LRGAKPKPAAELPPMDHVTIEEDRAKLAQPRQGPAPEIEKFVSLLVIGENKRGNKKFFQVPHKDQVQIKQKFKPKETKPIEFGKVEGADKPLKDIPPVVKE